MWITNSIIIEHLFVLVNARIILGRGQKRGEKVTVTGRLSMLGADRAIAPSDSHLGKSGCEQVLSAIWAKVVEITF
jgi:hypothetical protein